MNRLREVRSKLGLSQARFAALLAVPTETLRTWDSGRRPTPAAITARALALAREREGMPLHELARALRVHQHTLRTAARDGRLNVTYANHQFFGRPMPLATRAEGQAFMRTYYRQTTRWSAKPALARPLPDVPDNYHSRLIGLRLRLGITQAQLAATLGAASKAVVYQWESRKRKPSPLFWLRIQALERRAPRISRVEQ
jgi:DNA-binding transcriptional regulator YiaG